MYKMKTYTEVNKNIEIEIVRKPSDGKVKQIFFDPTGRHLIITTENGENYYLFEKWRKTKTLPKFKVKRLKYCKCAKTLFIVGCYHYFHCLEQTSHTHRPIHTRNPHRH
jgi:hypothetical protein